jgi:long-subunit acyl-CoA synthetase (AMP-forming)
MKPETLTVGPSSIQLLINFITLLPEIKHLAFSNLHTIVSTAAPYSTQVAKHVQKTFNQPLHNAFGMTEIQQALTTVHTTTDPKILKQGILGAPLHGVQIALIPYIKDTYKLFIKTPYGHKKILNEEATYIQDFFYTGDIIQLTSEHHLIYQGRENQDFINSGFGAKIALRLLKEWYLKLNTNIYHIEYYPIEESLLSFGIAATLFIHYPHHPKGIITNKKLIYDIKKQIKKTNQWIKNNIGHYEYSFFTINRFILINDPLNTTSEKNIDIEQIKQQYSSEIKALIKNKKNQKGIINLITLNRLFLITLYNLRIYRISLLRKALLKIFLQK